MEQGLVPSAKASLESTVDLMQKARACLVCHARQRRVPVTSMTSLRPAGRLLQHHPGAPPPPPPGAPDTSDPEPRARLPPPHPSPGARKAARQPAAGARARGAVALRRHRAGLHSGLRHRGAVYQPALPSAAPRVRPCSPAPHRHGPLPRLRRLAAAPAPAPVRGAASRYLGVRIRELQRAFRLRIVLCHVDVEDPAKPLLEASPLPYLLPHAGAAGGAWAAGCALAVSAPVAAPPSPGQQGGGAERVFPHLRLEPPGGGALPGELQGPHAALRPRRAPARTLHRSRPAAALPPRVCGAPFPPAESFWPSEVRRRRWQVLEGRTADSIRGHTERDYLSRITATLTAVRGINRMDVLTLGSRFGSLVGFCELRPNKPVAGHPEPAPSQRRQGGWAGLRHRGRPYQAGILAAGPEALSVCPGIGPTKVTPSPGPPAGRPLRGSHLSGTEARPCPGEAAAGRAERPAAARACACPCSWRRRRGWRGGFNKP